MATAGTALLAGISTPGSPAPAAAFRALLTKAHTPVRVGRPIPSSAFSCSTPTVFVSQGQPTQLYDSLYGAGEATFSRIGTTDGWTYNALGYDPANRYLYGVSTLSKNKSYPAGHLLKIGSKGEIDNLGAIKGDSYITTNGANNGAFAGGGFWVTSSDAAADEIDVSVSPPRVIKKVKFAPANSWHAADFTWANGFMWGMRAFSGHDYMYRLNLTSGAVRRFAAPSGIKFSSVFGAAWTYGNGNLGFEANTTGALLQIWVQHRGADAIPKTAVVSTYTAPMPHGANNGAACAPGPVDLSITKTGPARVTVGTKVTWTLKVTDHGPGISSGYVINDDLPSGVRPVASASPGCKTLGHAVTCTEGRLTTNSTASYTVTGEVPKTAGTCITSTAKVFGNELNQKPASTTSSVKTCTTKASPTLGNEAPLPPSGTKGGSFADKVTLSGGESPTGTITYALYGPTQPTCQGTPQTKVTTSASGDGTYTSPAVTLPTVGDYWWAATFGGDGNNDPTTPTACASGFFTVTARAPGTCTIDWSGPASGGPWDTASNWNLDRLPTTGDVVCIGTSSSPLNGPVTFNLSGSASIAQLESHAQLDVEGGELLITDTSSASAQESFANGLSMSGGQLGDPTDTTAGLTDTGTFSWTGGSFYAPSSQSPQPVLAQTGAKTALIENPAGYVDNWNLQLDGPLTIAAGSFDFEYAGGITESAAVTLTGAVTIGGTASAGGLTITSTGSLTSGSSVSELMVPVANAGTINAGGALTFSSLTDSGTLNLGTSSVTVGSTYSPNASSVLAVTIKGDVAGASYGQLVVIGAMNIKGQLDTTTGGGFTPTSGEPFTVASYTRESGSFSSMVGSGYQAPEINSTDIVLDARTTTSGGPPASGTAVCGTSVLSSPYSSAPSPLFGTSRTVSVAADNNANTTLDTPHTTYWLEAGTHTLGTNQGGQIVPGNDDVYVGAPGAIISGSDFDNEYAFVGSATPVWIEYLTIEEFSPNGGEGAVNGSSAPNWTVEYNTIEDNAPGYGVYAGSNNIVDYNCITLNGQGGFGTYTTLDTSPMTEGGSNVTVDYNEISYNDTCNWEEDSPNPVPPSDIQSSCAGAGEYSGCGCSGAGKFWQDYGSEFVGNYVHNDYSTGVWWDTDNDGEYMANNYIADEWDVPATLEISQNATILDNTFVDDEWGSGAANGASDQDFPTGTIFLNNGGGNAAVPTPTASIGTPLEPDGAGSLTTAGKVIISDNDFQNDWGTVVAFEDAGRFCGNPGVNPYPTCVMPMNSATYYEKGGTTAGGCGKYDLTGSRHGEASGSPEADYYDNCMWFDQGISVSHNSFSIDAAVLGPHCTSGGTSTEYCGSGGLFATCGCGGDGPSWNPYVNEENNIVNTTTYEDNDWSDNTYTYTGSVNFTFFYSNQSQVFTPAEWQAQGQDAGSTFGSSTQQPLRDRAGAYWLFFASARLLR